MNVELLAYTQLADGRFYSQKRTGHMSKIDDGKVLSFIAIRTCYSANNPTRIMEIEGEKYFDGNDNDKEANRLISMIYKSKHTSTLEHVNYTFAIEGVSRSLLAQLTRHRHMSFSVQSQRFVKFGSKDKSGGFDCVLPPSISAGDDRAVEAYLNLMEYLQDTYDTLRELGIPAEDARMVLPNSAICNIVMTCNLRSLIEFYEKRREGNGAQWEIAKLAEKLKSAVVQVEPWVATFLE